MSESIRISTIATTNLPLNRELIVRLLTGFLVLSTLWICLRGSARSYSVIAEGSATNL